MTATREARFGAAFAHLSDVHAYAARRGSRDPEGIAAETMAIAWRKLADVPEDDPRPWLYATARNLVYAEWRERHHERADAPIPDTAAFAADEVDADVGRALRRLSLSDREILFLVVWEDLAPAQAARALGISQAAFRVRLHRARRRFARALDAETETAPPLVGGLGVEER